MYALVYKDIPS